MSAGDGRPAWTNCRAFAMAASRRTSSMMLALASEEDTVWLEKLFILRMDLLAA